VTRGKSETSDTGDARHWDDSDGIPLSMGCALCPDLGICGGLHVRSGAFDCTSYCCGRPNACDSVCRKNPDFPFRAWEIEGFDLSRISEGDDVPFPELPSSIPLVYARGCRKKAFGPRAVALVLYQLIDRHRGVLKFDSRAEMCDHFGICRNTPIVLTGTDDDRSLERWWAIGERRRALLRGLSGMGVVAATTPNFSVFSDVPRWDNLHAMKRIAICWQEMVEAGIPTALHVNARTATDWRRWTRFVQERSEVSAITYEFATGAAGTRRQAYHVGALRGLADSVPQSLSLVVRGALSSLGDLANSFERVTMIDSTTYMKTAHRTSGTLLNNGHVSWTPATDRPDVDVDSLMDHNYLTMVRAIDAAVRRVVPTNRAVFPLSCS
jgi:hypothetical protein